MTRRLLDLLVAVVFLTITAPLQIVLAILIKYNSRGPIFSIPKMVGENIRTLSTLSLSHDAVLKLGRAWTPSRTQAPTLNQELELRYLQRRSWVSDTALMCKCVYALIVNKGNAKVWKAPDTDLSCCGNDASLLCWHVVIDKMYIPRRE